MGAQLDTIDFSSNDYLGFSRSKSIHANAFDILQHFTGPLNGASGSRLLSGNHSLYKEAESKIAQFHNASSALIFNSGYDANLGFFGCVPQRGDIIFYDELCHASIRDGIRTSHAKGYKFKHNNTKDLEHLLATHAKSKTSNETCYLVTESVFSMDGDMPDLQEIVSICQKFNCHVIVDEAHAVGVVGEGGVGLVQQLGLEDTIFARLVTFGKALGCHGAALLGSEALMQYLVNFARSFIYTTALPPHAIATVMAAYHHLQKKSDTVAELTENICFFKAQLQQHSLVNSFIPSDSCIQSCLIQGNTMVKETALILKERGLDVKPILSPTVPEGQERLRICLHSYNTEDEIAKLVTILSEQQSTMYFQSSE
ncbi:MAG: pyridoxal phosphate-dependent aminotransferase family protein [Marinirhabdus sp.]|nr:pyridoxal phosphate-dependent aminotransferase family protein [Marinirhabdus sp.]